MVHIILYGEENVVMGKSILNEYKRDKAVEYAHKWAFKRNPAYFSFDNFGGDCTNFVSQAIFAGTGVMNYTPVYGWYYIDSYRRTPSWTGVEFLYKFLVTNQGPGPIGERADIKDIMPGDIVQLSFNKELGFTHSMIIVETGISKDYNNILICAHTYDRDNYHLSSYNWSDIRFIHITGVRK